MEVDGTLLLPVGIWRATLTKLSRTKSSRCQNDSPWWHKGSPIFKGGVPSCTVILFQARELITTSNLHPHPINFLRHWAYFQAKEAWENIVNTTAKSTRLHDAAGWPPYPFFSEIASVRSMMGHTLSHITHSRAKAIYPVSQINESQACQGVP